MNEDNRKVAKQNMALALEQIDMSLRRYAVAHYQLYDALIGHDVVLGEEWLKVASGLLGLLNGETGKIDCGKLDGSIRQLAEDCGFNPDDIENM